MSSLNEGDTIQQLLLKIGISLPNLFNKTFDLTRIDKNALRAIITHDTTDVTKAVMDLQQDLALELMFIGEEIKELELQFDSSHIRRIENIFRNYIQRAYLLGTAYVNNIFNEKGFIDKDDLRIIKFLSEYYSQIFINNIQKVLNDPKVLLNPERSILDIQENRLNNPNVFNNIADSIGAVFQALQVSTVVKTVVLLDIYSVLVGKSSNIEFGWAVSKDERVCPICFELSKRSWEVENYHEIPLIPHGAHPNCKCRILLRFSSNVRT